MSHGRRQQLLDYAAVHGVWVVEDDYDSEFRYGAFTRVLPLPPGASETDVTATYADGILEVRVPTRTDGDRSHKVTVTRG